MMKSLRWWIMNNFGRFSQAKICFFIHKGGVFALHQSVKVFSQVFFKKLAGLGSAHKTALSFCQAFSLRLSCQRKSGIMVFYVFSWGEGNFLKEAFLSPHPYPSRTLKLGGLFFAIISALDARTYNVRTVTVPTKHPLHRTQNVNQKKTQFESV